MSCGPATFPGQSADEAEPFVCPLSHLRPGTACRIKELAASPELAHRLREMGFCEEKPIRLVSQSANLICQVCNVRLGISAELAASILVEPILCSRD